MYKRQAYDPPAGQTHYDGATEVSTYLQLTLAINNLVSEHGDSLLLHFTNYSGNIEEDMACLLYTSLDKEITPCPYCIQISGGLNTLLTQKLAECSYNKARRVSHTRLGHSRSAAGPREIEGPRPVPDAQKHLNGGWPPMRDAGTGTAHPGDEAIVQY